MTMGARVRVRANVSEPSTDAGTDVDVAARRAGKPLMRAEVAAAAMRVRATLRPNCGYPASSDGLTRLTMNGKRMSTASGKGAATAHARAERLGENARASSTPMSRRMPSMAMRATSGYHKRTP
jgi:hypothetical protein